METQYNISLKPRENGLPIPVQQGIRKPAQAEALKTIYPKSANPTVEADRVSISEEAARKIEKEPPRIAKEMKESAREPNPQELNSPEAINQRALYGIPEDTAKTGRAAQEANVVKAEGNVSRQASQSSYSAAGVPQQTQRITFEAKV